MDRTNRRTHRRITEEIVKMDRKLQTVGMATFVEYLELCQQNRHRKNWLVFHIQERHGYKDNSASTKISTLFRIIDDGDTRPALKKIAASRRVSAQTCREARRLLVTRN